MEGIRKMKDKIRIFVLGLLLASLLMPFMGTPVYSAEVSTEIKMGDKVILDSGDTATFLGKSGDKYRYMATLGAPKYIPGTTTEINTSWHYDTGKGEWSSGANMFDALVKGEKVTVTKDGQKLSWTPSVLVGTKDTKALAKEPILLPQDPINENYYENTLRWDYGNGITRNLRIIEGMLIEYYTVSSLPTGNIFINPHSVKDLDFVWTRPSSAWDAEGEPVELSLGVNGILTLNLEEMQKATFPITIDPDTTFTTSSSDGSFYYSSGSYSGARTASTASNLYPSSSSLMIGQYYYSPNYKIWRSLVYFDTSGLPNGCTIDSAVLKLYGGTDYSDTDFDIVVQSGMPDYPEDPFVGGDYLYTHYAGDGGTFNTSGFSISAYNELTLDATGRGWIDKEGVTKFCLRSSRDIAGTTLSGQEHLSTYAYEQGDGYWPQLVIIYTASNPPTVTPVAASDISTTTAKLHGYLNNDGGEECQIMFEYDIDSGTPYAENTGWLATNYTTGQSFEKVIEGLNVDDVYYFRAVAKNSAGTTNSTELNFTTLATLNPPTNFKAIPRSNTEVSLSWVKGVGSSQTMVRYKVGEYPSTTGGDLACNITKTSYSLTGLTPGTTYYFRAWGYDAGAFSATNTTEMATTLAGAAAVESPITAPLIPSNFFGPSTYTNLSNLPVYDLFNSLADIMGMPRENFWMYIMFALTIVLGAAFFMMTKQPIFAIIGTSLGIGYGYLSGPIPGWVLLVYVIAAGSVALVLLRGGEGYA